eukprot:scaffold38450_cov43-Prasinocladus_malaysianus.AAC.1
MTDGAALQFDRDINRTALHVAFVLVRQAMVSKLIPAAVAGRPELIYMLRCARPCPLVRLQPCDRLFNCPSLPFS